MEEISQCNAMRALKDAVKKLTPGSVELEHAAALHALEILKSCLKLNGRDTEKFLKKTIPCLIRYLDYNLCDQQAVMTEQMHAVVRQIQQSQSDMQVHNKTLSAAVTSLYEFTENPSCDTSFQHTATMLEEAVATAEVEQHTLLDNAVSIATKMNSLYQNRPLGPQAQLCMELHNQFMDIISRSFGLLISPKSNSWNK